MPQLTLPDNSPHPRPRPNLKWPLLILTVSLLLRMLLPASVIENFFSRGVFVAFRYLFDYTFGWSPVPLFYVFWLVVGWLLWRGVRRALHAGAKQRLKTSVLLLLRFVCIFVSVFLWVWGFNYGRLPVEESMGFEIYEPTVDELRKTVYAEAERLAILRTEFMPDTFAVTAADLPIDLEASVRPLLAHALVKHRFSAPGRPRARQLLPRGILLRLSTAGVYWPWVAEGNVDAGLHPLQKPAVMAHELSHAYGFGYEGTCSFLAWLAGEEAADAALSYAFRLDYWRRLASRLRYADPVGYFQWRGGVMDPGIQNDLEAIYANGERYQDIMPVIRDATYNVYLKAQGVQDGLMNYGRVVQLVEGYKLVDS